MMSSLLLINTVTGALKSFLSICYEFSKSGVCTFTYLIDEQSVELLSDDLEKFKQNLFGLKS